jgi:hypothetical protein
MITPAGISPRFSLSKIIAAKPTAAFDPKWDNFLIDSDFFTRLIYDGV